MYYGKKSEMGERMRQLRMLYTSAKRELIDPFPDLGTEAQSCTTSDTESSENMQVSTPTMSVSSESDLSEISDNKGNSNDKYRSVTSAN